MSLIDDALKRAQAAGEAPPGKPGERPWIPAPLPDAGLARRRRLARSIGIALALGAAAAAGVIVIGRIAAEAPPLPAGEGRGEGHPLAAAPLPTAALTAAEPAHFTARTRPTGLALPAQEGEGAGARAAAVPSPAVPAPRPQSLVDGRTYAGSIVLPGGAKIELGGIAWSETEPRALVNDRIVAAGAYVEGFTISRIEEGRVALEKDGLTIFLSVK